MEPVKIEELVEEKRVAEVRKVREEMQVLTKTCQSLVKQLAGIMKKMDEMAAKVSVS